MDNSFYILTATILAIHLNIKIMILHVLSLTITREFLQSVINLFGQIADYGTFFIIGIFTYIYHPLLLEWRWISLLVCILYLSRYTAMATMLDIYKWKKNQSYLKYPSEERLMYLTFRGSVALTLTMQIEGELIDNIGVNTILRIILLSVWISVLGVIVGMKQSAYYVCFHAYSLCLPINRNERNRKMSNENI